MRQAEPNDIPALQALIERTGIGLSAGFYTDEQARAVTREVFGVDSQLVADGTYYVIEYRGALVACGGWGKRSTECGGDKCKTGPDRLLDPRHEAAFIRAFLSSREWGRRDRFHHWFSLVIEDEADAYARA